MIQMSIPRAKASALKKVFYIHPELYDKLPHGANEKRMSIDDYAKSLLTKRFMLKDFLEGIDLYSY